MKSISLKKYEGRWYEIATMKKIFEKNCDTAVADYSYNEKEKVLDVTNYCLSLNESGNGYTIYSSIHGHARPTSNPQTLKLKFDNIPFEMDYNILWTDYKNFSIVGKKGSGRILSYYWVLGRRPTITDKEKKMLQKRTLEYGFRLEDITENNNSAFLV